MLDRICHVLKQGGRSSFSSALQFACLIYLQPNFRILPNTKEKDKSHIELKYASTMARMAFIRQNCFTDRERNHCPGEESTPSMF